MKMLRYAESIGHALVGAATGFWESVIAEVRFHNEIARMDHESTESAKRACEALQKMAFASKESGGSFEPVSSVRKSNT